MRTSKMDISKLPPGIIENILCQLPLQDAARTSILSRGWRYRWIKIPKLEFTKDKFEVLTGGAEMPGRCKLFNVMYQILLIHEGPILEFTLSIPSLVEIDLIILHLSKKNTVKILKLDFTGSYRLPLSFFALNQLTELYLNDCVISHQPPSSGFGSLTTLHMQEIRTCEKALLHLLSSCPLLKRLTIMSDGGTIDSSGDSTIADFFECLPVIEYLSVWFLIFKCFVPNRLPKELPTALVHLKCLCMESVWFSYKYAVPLFALLIRSSPNLEKLKLVLSLEDMYDEPAEGSFILDDYTDIVLKHLKDLEILHFSNEENELAILELILANSPVLI